MEPAAIPAWNFLEIFSTPVQIISNQFHVNFKKLPRSRHIPCDFKFSIAILTKYHNQTVFVLRGFPCTLKQQKNMFFPRLALSLTCTDTPCLSPGDCLLDAGMFEQFHIRVALHFGFHRDTVLNLWKHFHVSIIAYACLRSYHQRVISKGYGVYTRVTHLCNRLQIACAVSWSIPGLYTINAKTDHIHLRGAHHLPLPTLRVGLHPMIRENYHRAQLTGLMASQMKNSQVSTSPTHCWKPFSTGWKCWTCVGWDGVLISPFVSAAFQSQQICNNLVEISC